MLLMTLGAVRPARADLTAFVGNNASPSNRLVRGVAVGFSLLVIGFEFEFSDTRADAAADAPGLKTGMANLLVQTPFGISGLQFYATAGAGLYKEEGGAIGDYGLDANDSCAMTVEFGNGALGVVHMSRSATGRENDLDLTIHGEKGALKIWSNTTDSTLSACLGPDIETQTWKVLDCPPTPRNADRFVLALLSGVNGQPDFRHAAQVQTLLDLAIRSDAQGRMLTVD